MCIFSIFPSQNCQSLSSLFLNSLVTGALFFLREASHIKNIVRTFVYWVKIFSGALSSSDPWQNLSLHALCVVSADSQVCYGVDLVSMFSGASVAGRCREVAPFPGAFAVGPASEAEKVQLEWLQVPFASVRPFLLPLLCTLRTGPQGRLSHSLGDLEELNRPYDFCLETFSSPPLHFLSIHP